VRAVPHRVTISDNGNLMLTTFADAQKLLNEQGVAPARTGATVNATVKGDATALGVSEIFSSGVAFLCRLA